MGFRQITDILICSAFSVLPLSVFSQEIKEYEDMRLSGRIDPIDNLRYVDSVVVTYHNSRKYPSGGHIRITVPVQKNRFSLWVPPLPVGDDVWVRLKYRNIPDSANKILDVAAYRLMIGDSLVDISIGKGAFNARVKKYKLRTDILNGEQNKLRLAYLSSMLALRRMMDTLRNKLHEKKIDSALYMAEMQKKRQELNDIDEQFIFSNPGALHSLHLMEKIVGKYLNKQGGWNSTGDARFKEIEKLFGSLNSYLQESENGRHLTASLKRARERKVIPFTGTMPDGQQFDLNSLKGKIFLIDFWGSWCGWCRKSHPHLKELYAKYKDKGFEIIGVGEEFGAGKKQWERFKKAIAEDGITWPQVLNDPSKQDIVSQYMVTSFPSKFLVDRDGNIILRVLSDNERLLDAKLKELFGE